MIDTTNLLNATIDAVQVFRPLHHENTGVFSLLITQDSCQRSLPAFPISRLDRFSINSLDPRYVVIAEDERSANNQLRTIIKREIADQIRQQRCGIYFDKMGWTQLPNQSYVYVAGNRILGNIENYSCMISPALQAITLPDLPEIDDATIVKRFFKNIARDIGILLPLVAFSIRSSLESIYRSCGYPMRFLLYLSGVQGSGKTTAATDFSTPYNNALMNEPAFHLQALSSQPAVRDFIAENRDICLLVDDVCTSSDSATQRKSATLAAYTIRFAANSVAQQKKLPNRTNEFIQNHSGVIITGEFPMQKASDLTRCVIVNVDHQMRNRRTDDRLFTAAAMSRFLTFCAEHYSNICSEITNTFSKFRADQSNSSSPRMQQHLAELELAFNLLLNYARAIGVLTTSEKKQWQSYTHTTLQKSLSESNRLIEQYNRSNSTDITLRIRELLDLGYLQIAKKRKNYDPDKYDGFKDKSKGLLYLKLDALARELGKQTGKVYTSHAVGNMLRQCGLIEIGAENHTAT